MDLPESADNLKKFKRRVKRPIVPIDGADDATVEHLKAVLREHLVAE
jgi:hypothetical protein